MPHERDFGIAAVIPGMASQSYTSPIADETKITARHYLLAVARNPGMCGDDLMPKDKDLSRAAQRLWDRLPPDDREIIRYFAHEETDNTTEKMNPERRKARFDRLILEMAFEGKLLNPRAWITKESKEGEENEHKEFTTA